ncbi:uncharacterized protein LOC143299503 isoform X2 [Babylonia areolata]|uniref:uncharacterized protein LOC143299503 isoform X2 n=1 Tax=Babylonia areolata TaxID=304850 RepID=UPI003FD210AD
MGADQSKEKEGGADPETKKSSCAAASLNDKLQKSRAEYLSEVLNCDDDDHDDCDDVKSDESARHPPSEFSPEVEKTARQVDPRQYDFSFENLVFEGGGNKGVAYCGAIKCLEDHGVLKKIHRFAGTSAGASVAALLACGFTAQEVEDITIKENKDSIFLDAKLGYLCLIPNLIKYFGWHPAQRLYEWFGEKLRQKTGNPDVTFLQLYHQRGKELCIVVTNLTQMDIQYCHPKTTPNMPIRLAVRMSLSIPVLFAAVRHSFSNVDGLQDVVVDGGVMCNYPIHCFDGWYLSMKAEDTFVRRLQPLCDIPRLMEKGERFMPRNDRTLGLLLYSHEEDDAMRAGLERRCACKDPSVPRERTKLFRKWKENNKRKRNAEKGHNKLVKAIDSFLAVLRKHDKDGGNTYDIHELEAAFQDKTVFSDKQAEVLFGKDFTVSQVFDLLDIDNSGEISLDELVHFVENHGVDLHTLFLGQKRQNIDGFLSFLTTLQNTLLHNVQRLHQQTSDTERSVGINTGYVDTTDFSLEKADIQFLFERGYNSTKAFLQYHVATHPDKVLKEESLPESPTVFRPLAN